jgi:hypothetical protein
MSENSQGFSNRTLFQKVVIFTRIFLSIVSNQGELQLLGPPDRVYCVVFYPIPLLFLPFSAGFFSFFLFFHRLLSFSFLTRGD